MPRGGLPVREGLELAHEGVLMSLGISGDAQVRLHDVLNLRHVATDPLEVGRLFGRPASDVPRVAAFRSRRSLGRANVHARHVNAIYGGKPSLTPSAAHVVLTSPACT